MKLYRVLIVAAIAWSLCQVSYGGPLRRWLRGRRPRPTTQAVVSGSYSVGGGARYQTRAQRSPQELALIRLIREQQAMHVRESWGTQDYQCFTWDDWAWFTGSRVPGQITSELRKDEQFLGLVDEIRQMNTRERSTLLARAARTYKPTWRQLGRISRAGQTAAGQRAERLIAQAIVNVVGQLLKEPSR